MAWQTAFRIANVSIAIEAETDQHRDVLQDIVSLYEISPADSPDIRFHLDETAGVMTLSANGDILWQSTEYRDFPPALEIHLYRLALAFLSTDLLSLHASCLDVNRQAVIFAGISGSGKSSLATAALLNDATYLSDEFSLLDEKGMVHPFPRPLQWDGETHPAFSRGQMLADHRFSYSEFSFPDPEGKMVTSRYWYPSRTRHRPMPCYWIVLPRYDAEAPPASLTQIRRSEALMQLMQHLHRPLSPAENMKMLNSHIPASVRFYSLAFSDVHAAWKMFSRAVEDQPVS